MDSRQHRLPFLLLGGARTALREHGSEELRRLRDPGRNHDLLLGKRTLVHGQSVLLGQTGGTLRGLSNFARTHNGDTRRNVSGRGSQHGAVSCPGGGRWLAFLRSSAQPLVASCGADLRSHAGFALRDGHDALFPLSGVRAGGRVDQRGAARARLPNLGRLLPLDRDLLPISLLRAGLRISDTPDHRDGRAEESSLLLSGAIEHLPPPHRALDNGWSPPSPLVEDDEASGGEGEERRDNLGEAAMSSVKTVLASIRIGWGRESWGAEPLTGVLMKTIGPVSRVLSASVSYWPGP